MDILKFLKRKDKWYLGGGNRLIWSPPFPVWLDRPGFWDKANYYNYSIEPVFTWTILDESGKEIRLKAKKQRWRPSDLYVKFKTKGITVRELKCCLPNDVLASCLRIKNKTRIPRRFHFIAWRVQTTRPTEKRQWLTDVQFQNEMLFYNQHNQDTSRPHFQFGCAFALNKMIYSHSVILSQGGPLQPHFDFSPFPEQFQHESLSNELKLQGIDKDGHLYMALHSTFEIKPGQETDVHVYFSAAPDVEEASKNIEAAKDRPEPVEMSRHNWLDYFNQLPCFESSNEFLTRYYWYRWYGLRLFTLNGQEGHYKYPAVCEGLDYFRAPISYSAVCHILETRWMPHPRIAEGSLLNFIANQRKDGGFRGYLDVNYYRQDFFYHANWGHAVIELFKVHKNRAFLENIYAGLVKYVDYFDKVRDPENSSLYDIHNHYETGQEYMHRYLAVHHNADKKNWGRVFRLKGVDVSVYIYQLKQALSFMTAELSLSDATVRKWSKGAEKIKQAILDKMWDDDGQMFFDVNPETDERTKIKAATCFYPYMTDIVSGEHVPGLKAHLLNADEFWTPYPVPSSSADDPYFSAEAEWQGKRMNCPWNGRVWPMTNSHIAEALAQTAIRFNDSSLKEKAVEFITKFITMMFYEGDPELPNCFEHYNPFTGTPSLYRGVDDYQHSWVVDLIIKYVAGIRPEIDKIIIDPFPFEIDFFRTEKVQIAGNELKVIRENERFEVWKNRKKVASSVVGKPVEIVSN